MNNSNFTHQIDIGSNYTDLFILLNDKEKLHQFINHMVMFLVQKNNDDKEERGDDFLPSFIHNEKGKTIELDYNLLVLILRDWVKTLGYPSPNDIVEKFKFDINWGLSRPSNASIFFIANLLGIHHKITRTGVSIKFGVATQSQLFCVPIVFENDENKKVFQYNSVSFYLSKLENIIKENEYEQTFLNQLNDSVIYQQVAYGSKNVQDFWEKSPKDTIFYINKIS